jgi:hypothetical protein
MDKEWGERPDQFGDVKRRAEEPKAGGRDGTGE